MIYFNCDYTEGAHPKIIEKLTETNMEQTIGYGMDEHCKHAADLIKEACSAPGADVHFLVGGTQTNVTVIDASLRAHRLCGHTFNRRLALDDCHPILYETLHRSHLWNTHGVCRNCLGKTLCREKGKVECHALISSIP